jgi:hypothetical protein
MDTPRRLMNECAVLLPLSDLILTLRSVLEAYRSTRPLNARLIDHFVREGGRNPRNRPNCFSCVMILCGHLRSGVAEALHRQTSRKSAQL